MAPVRFDLIVGARPNFVKAAPLFRALGRYPDEFAVRLVHTGQHYDADMSDVFFRDLELPRPDVHLEVGAGTHGAQTAEIIARYERAFVADAPRLVVVVGDVNSTMACALVAAKGGARVAHVEAGLRSFDSRMPEEVNRVVTDRLSDLLFTPSRDANENLLREGAPEDAIFLVGNVMIDSLVRCRPAIDRATSVETIGLRPGGYGVLTLHRPSNVDEDASLRETLAAIERVQRRIPLVFPVHPRTARALERAGRPALGNVRLVPPLGYLDFLKLVKESRFVVTDSGGVQEESTYLGVPCLTMRESTERPITVEQGTNILVSRDGACLDEAVGRILAGRGKLGTVPPLWDGETAPRIVEVLRVYAGGSRWSARLAGAPDAGPATGEAKRAAVRCWNG